MRQSCQTRNLRIIESDSFVSWMPSHHQSSLPLVTGSRKLDQCRRECGENIKKTRLAAKRFKLSNLDFWIDSHLGMRIADLGHLLGTRGSKFGQFPSRTSGSMVQQKQWYNYPVDRTLNTWTSFVFCLCHILVRHFLWTPGCCSSFYVVYIIW